ITFTVPSVSVSSPPAPAPAPAPAPIQPWDPPCAPLGSTPLHIDTKPDAGQRSCRDGGAGGCRGPPPPPTTCAATGTLELPPRLPDSLGTGPT
ncbi:unnamed protein product, partial [Discosporangium mesarthrocarpum]